MSVTLHFQSTGTVPGNGRPITLSGRSLTIGRGDENDVVLPDPDRLISKRHCAIEDNGGTIVVIDFSTNGTFLNYGKVALGNVATPLNDGDILTLGSYELLVEIRDSRRADPLANLPPPLDEAPVTHGNAARAGNMSLLDDPGRGNDFLDDLLGGAKPSGPSKVSRPQLGDDGLLPPLGESEGGLLGPARDPNEGMGASRPSHSPSVEDHFTPPKVVPQAIPDDWDDDLMAPGKGDEDPFAAPSAPIEDFARPAFIPDDALDDLSAEPAPPAEVPAAKAPEAVTPEPEAPEPEEPLVLQPRPRPAEPESTAAPPAPPVAPPAAPVAPPPATPVERASGADDAAARAFLRAAGVEHLPIPDAELLPTMSRLGHVLRVLIHGVREVLMTRTSIKSEFRINQTMISAGGNNPLKFSISPEQAVETMVKPSSRGYLDATEAAEQAMRDIKAHEVAMMTGMEAALKGVLKKLAPSELEGKIETNGGIGSILKGKKARYWEVYEKLYAEISDQAENDFNELFAKEFARAYQDQLEKLK